MGHMKKEDYKKMNHSYSHVENNDTLIHSMGNKNN